VLSGGASASEPIPHLVTLKEQIFRDCRSDVEQLIDEALKDKVVVARH
jgi:hypothetical protein